MAESRGEGPIAELSSLILVDRMSGQARSDQKTVVVDLRGAPEGRVSQGRYGDFDGTSWMERQEDSLDGSVSTVNVNGSLELVGGRRREERWASFFLEKPQRRLVTKMSGVARTRLVGDGEECSC